jgi:hypothetical protein
MLFARAKGQAAAICLCACNFKNFEQFSGDKVEIVRRVRESSRGRRREVFEKRFTATHKAQDYVRVYKRLINNGQDKVLGRVHNG